MSTHNLGFYEELTKNIFQLSSNIIKYKSYLLFWCTSSCFCRVSFVKLLVLDVDCENCNFSRSSINAKFFFSPQTPESPGEEKIYCENKNIDS